MKRKKNNPNQLFSDELLDRMKPLHDMDISEALCDSRFWKALCEHSGIDFEELSKKALADIPESERKPLTPDDFGGLLKIIEEGMEGATFEL